MRNLLLLCFIGFSALSLAQSSVSPGDDKALQTLINKTERGSRKQEFLNDYEPQSDFERGVVMEFERYYRALMTQDVNTTYNMMSNLYRKVVDFNSYTDKERYQISKVHMMKVQFSGETCALARGYMMANTAQLGTVKVPLKLYLFLEEGSWHVYKNPYETIMFTLPEGKNVKKPCTF